MIIRDLLKLLHFGDLHIKCPTNMLAAKLLASPMRQSVVPTTCRALAHTDIQFHDNPANKRLSTTTSSQKKNIESLEQRRVSSQSRIKTNNGARAIDEKSLLSKSRLSQNDAPQLATEYFDQFDSYCQMINDAKSLAKRSILIDHCGLEHIDLKSEFNNVEQIYSIEKETKRGLTKLSLVEFKCENDADSVAQRARHNDGLLPVPLKIFRYNGPTSTSPNQQNLPYPVNEVRLTNQREVSSNFASYTEFISNNMMSLIDLKMRFITLVNFERVLCAGMFSEYELMPFGSSVIDLGCDSCDLDLVITRKENHHELINNILSSSKKPFNPEPSSRLVHLDKSLFSETRDPSGVRGSMRWFDHILREYMPLTDGYSVLFLRYAKVPIIKFTSRVTSLDCDLSFNFGLDHREQDLLTTNYSGIIMSQIIFSLCRHNNIFAAVAIYLRIFAKLTSITSKGPSVGLTNFQFLSLILFYLQQISITRKASKQNTKPNSWPELRVENYKYKTQEPIVSSFREILTERISDRQTAGKASKQINTEQLNQLLPEIIVGFFKFYSNFDFSNCSMNLYESKIERKLDNSSIYVLNPLDRNRNICHNVNRKGLEQLVQRVRTAFECCKRDETPLTLIRSLMLSYQEQSKKDNPHNDPHEEHYDLRGGGLVTTTECIAQDIFR